MRKIKRREFLKMASAIPAGVVLSNISRRVATQSLFQNHIIVLVLDTLSARNMSLYGYPRDTTPNINRFAERSNVYHAHYSGGTFTTSGTASLLTGTYPWTHRAINLEGLVSRPLAKRNIFQQFDSHTRLAFTQNYFAQYLLTQFENDIESHLPMGAFSELEQYVLDTSGAKWISEFRAVTDLAFAQKPGSLALGIISKYLKAYRLAAINTQLANVQRYGVELTFSIRKVFAGLANELSRLERPSLCYLHLFPPHGPYQPHGMFNGLFVNGWKPKAKPRHALWKEETSSRKTLNDKRLKYDQYLADTDHAFGEFIDQLDSTGVLDNSYFILTSDHGESFERGYFGHAGPYVYEPSIHIPLLISAPGQVTRRDFDSVTNSVDVLPTLLSISGREIPDWCEGEVLPGFGREVRDLQTRATFTVEAKYSSAFGTLPTISIAMRRGNFKMIYYKGYNDIADPYYEGVFEMYNLAEDPEELNDLVNVELSLARDMKDELLSAYDSSKQVRPL